MKFQFIGNACGIFISNLGTRVLCDPWLIDGVFEGSWHHYPPLHTTYKDLENVDAIYISHIHPDHFDQRYIDYLRKDVPVIILDHPPNFLKKSLGNFGFKNLIEIKDKQTVDFRDMKITMFAPFTKLNFHEAEIGNLIDSAMLIEADGQTAFNTNDNTPNEEACRQLASHYPRFDLVMLNYNAAGPYPSCFQNLSEKEKHSEHARILQRNFQHMLSLLKILKPRSALPFAGAYVLGGSQWRKNQYLGTTTWDEVAQFVRNNQSDGLQVVTMRENQKLDLRTLELDTPYTPIDVDEMNKYIQNEISNNPYPHERLPKPDEVQMMDDIRTASGKLIERLQRFKLKSQTQVVLDTCGRMIQIFPTFALEPRLSNRYLKCKMDDRLLHMILHRKANWNSAEIGAHIDFWRVPNHYDFDLHTSLQFFHL